MEYAKPGGHGALRGSVPPGLPDLDSIKDGKHIWFEVKLPGQHSTPVQLQKQQELRDAGDWVFEVHSLEEVLAALTEAGETVRSRLT